MSSRPLAIAVDEVKSRFIAENPKSDALHTSRLDYLPNGNTRSVLHYYPFPVCFRSGRGCYLTSVDGKEYIDFLGEYTAGLFGHSHPVILDSLKYALYNGVNLGGVNELEGQLAEAMCKRFGLGRVRFTNSATEANVMALAAAKIYTGRQKILVFAEGYHGGSLGFPHGKPSPLNIPHDWVIAPYNDIATTNSILSSLPSNSVAAILVEPMQGSAGCYPADPSFLEYLSTTATNLGAVLIFDETMTSRLHWGGLQAKFNIKPDMTTLGKYLAGGMSFGAFGGKKEIMDIFTELKHSGTFNNNILSMTGGVAAYGILTPEVLDGMNNLGDHLRTEIEKALELAGGRVTITGTGSLMCFHFFGKEGEVDEQLKELFFFYLMVEEGLYLANRGFMSLSIVHERKHVERMVQAVRRFVAKYKGFLVE